MRTLGFVFRREARAYVESPIAGIFASVFLAATGAMFMNDFFLVGVAEMDAFFEPLPLVMLLFMPALSMRLWAEEKETNTYEYLRTLPLRPQELILAKYGASLAFFLLTLSGTFPIVAMLYRLGTPDGGRMAASYVATVGLGAMYLSISHFLSSLSRDQIVAYLTSALTLGALVAVGDARVAGILDGLWVRAPLGSFLRDTLSPVPHFELMCRGLLDLHAVLYFLLMVLLPLWLTGWALERDRC